MPGARPVHDPKDGKRLINDFVRSNSSQQKKQVLRFAQDDKSFEMGETK